MDNKTISIQAILDGIDYLDVNFMAKLDEEIDHVLEVYNNLKSGGMSSSSIDVILDEIKLKVTSLQSSYQEVCDSIKKEMGVTEELVSQSSKSILDVLSNGN